MKDTTIYLWTDEGWKEFKLSDKAELEKRNIYIGDRTLIGYGTRIGDGTHIGYGTRIGDGTHIGYGTLIGDGTIIGSRTSIGSRTRIGSNQVVKSMTISGSMHPLSYWGQNCIQIGCRNHSIEWWQGNYEAVGEREDYTTEQIEEYKGYIELIASLHPTWGDPSEDVEKLTE